MDLRSDTSTVVLVEGDSDRVALETLAERRGHALDEHHVAVVAMDGITNIRRALLRFGPRGDGLGLAGLYDIAEQRHVRRGLASAGVDRDDALRRESDLERIGFFACRSDLEDELIRAIGIDGMLTLIEARGRLESFRRLQRQPAQRTRPIERQLHRFLGGRSGHKYTYARAIVEQLDLDAVPSPLQRLLDHVLE